MVGEELIQSEMLCGGIVDVLLEPVFPDHPMTKEVFQKTNDLVHEGKMGTLLTLVADGMDYNRHSRVVMESDGTITGDFEDDLAVDASSNEKWSKANKPEMIEVEEGAPAIFIEPIVPDTVLYLFGAGHISTFVAPLAKMVGFRVCVIDDREEFANSTRFPNADELIVCPFHDAFNRISINASSYIAIITRGHIHDRDVLRDALQTNSAYIGMIGSLRKRKIIYKSLAAEGVSKETLQQVHSPIGLDIGAETPEEIAVSIVAELIQARLNRAVKKPPFINK
jgi:xanthine dehydrogenase accessory factor